MGTVGIRKSTSETLADKRKFWKHDAFVAVPGGDMMAHVFTYGGPNSAATAEGIYFLTARVVFGSMPTVEPGGSTSLQLYANCVRRCILSTYTDVQ